MVLYVASMSNVLPFYVFVSVVGVISSAVLYGALILSCMFLPKIIINAVGHKWTIPLMFLAYLSWMAANG